MCHYDQTKPLGAHRMECWLASRVGLWATVAAVLETMHWQWHFYTVFFLFRSRMFVCGAPLVLSGSLMYYVGMNMLYRRQLRVRTNCMLLMSATKRTTEKISIVFVRNVYIYSICRVFQPVP